MENFLDTLYEIEKEYYIKLPNDIRECHYNGLIHKGRLSHYIESNIDRVADFTNCKGTEGVYMMGEFYIGKSKNIKRRISIHLEEALFDVDKWNSSAWFPIPSGNEEKVRRTRTALLQGKLKVTLLSENVKDETKLIRDGYNKYKLTNRTK